jgi:hypothetical protein
VRLLRDTGHAREAERLLPRIRQIAGAATTSEHAARREADRTVGALLAH